MVYVLIEMQDIELTDVRVFFDKSEAEKHFEAMRDETGSELWDESEMEDEIEGTLMVAGDDAYSIQLVERGTLGGEN